MDDLIKRLRDGVVEHDKRWSGDTHADLGGSANYAATEALMAEAADAIAGLTAALRPVAEGPRDGEFMESWIKGQMLMAKAALEAKTPNTDTTE